MTDFSLIARSLLDFNDTGHLKQRVLDNKAEGLVDLYMKAYAGHIPQAQSAAGTTLLSSLIRLGLKELNPAVGLSLSDQKEAIEIAAVVGFIQRIHLDFLSYIHDQYAMNEMLEGVMHGEGEGPASIFGMVFDDEEYELLEQQMSDYLAKMRKKGHSALPYYEVEYQGHIKNIKGRRSMLSKKLLEIENKIDDKSKALQEIDNKIEALKISIKDKERDVGDKSKEVESLEKSKSKLQEEIKHLETSRVDFKALDSAMLSLEVISNEVTRFKDEMRLVHEGKRATQDALSGRWSYDVILKILNNKDFGGTKSLEKLLKDVPDIKQMLESNGLSLESPLSESIYKLKNMGKFFNALGRGKTTEELGAEFGLTQNDIRQVLERAKKGVDPNEYLHKHLFMGDQQIKIKGAIGILEMTSGGSITERNKTLFKVLEKHVGPMDATLTGDDLANHALALVSEKVESTLDSLRNQLDKQGREAIRSVDLARKDLNKYKKTLKVFENALEDKIKETNEARAEIQRLIHAKEKLGFDVKKHEKEMVDLNNVISTLKSESKDLKNQISQLDKQEEAANQRKVAEKRLTELNNEKIELEVQKESALKKKDKKQVTSLSMQIEIKSEEIKAVEKTSNSYLKVIEGFSPKRSFTPGADARKPIKPASAAEPQSQAPRKRT